MQVRIGKLVVDLDQCAIFESEDFDGGPEVRVYYLSERFVFTAKSAPAEYRALKAHMEKQMPLDIYNLQMMRSDAFDPFMDEMARTLFSVFQSLPGSEDMVLSLLHDGQGGVWFANERDPRIENALVRWNDFDDALERLQSFKKQQSE